MADAALAPLLLQFAAAYGCMLVIPGSNTLLVLQVCDGASAARPLMAAAGVATGATLASIVAASSAAALPTGPGFKAVSGLLVAALLLRAALQSFRPRPPAGVPTARAAEVAVAPFLLGFGTALINPVSVPYFASFFVSHACGRLASALTCGLVFVMAGLWFSSVGLVSARMGRLPVPAIGRRALDWAIAATLAAFAVRSLWVALAM